MTTGRDARRARLRSDADAEFRFHLEMRAKEYEAQGLSPEDARARARAQFGAVEAAATESVRMDDHTERRRRVAGAFGDLRLDVRGALRQLRQYPFASVVAVVTLALGIGATTATWAAIHRLILQPLPGADADTIVRLSRSNRDRTLSVTPTFPMIDAWRALPGVDDIATLSVREVTFQVGAQPESLEIGEMSPNLPALLGMPVTTGRSFRADDDRVGLVTEGFARRRLGGVAGALGQVMTIDGQPYTVVGLLPADFAVPFVGGVRRDVWVRQKEDPATVFPHAIARVRVGLDPATLEAAMSGAIESIGDSHDRPTGWLGRVTRPRDELGPTTENTLFVLLGAVAIVLVAACANVANLLVARAHDRSREFLVRQALGASRGRLVRQHLVESGAIAFSGWVLGVGLASLGLALVRAARPDSLSLLDGVALDGRLVAVSLLLAFATAVVVGVAPAVVASGRRLADDLRRQSASTTADRTVRRWRGTLVVVEIALSVMLLVGAGLLVRSLLLMGRAPLGFVAEDLHATELQLPERYGTADARRAVLADVAAAVSAMPGVTAVTFASSAPPEPGVSVGILEFEGQPRTDPGRTFIGFVMASSAFFDVAGIRLIEGRVFGDAPPTAEDVLINETFARRAYPDGSAIGRRLRLSEDSEWLRVIGIVADVALPRVGGRTAATDRVVYSPFVPHFDGVTLLVRGRFTGQPLFALINRAVAGVDATIRVREARPMTALVDRALALPRFVGGLLAAFAVVAVLLSAIGVYGVVMHAVSSRRRELGIRRVLGAPAGDLLRSVLGSGALLVATGVVLGLSAAALLTRTLTGLLFGVTPLDGRAFGAAVLLLFVTAMAAFIPPARRAIRVDPMAVLRQD